MNIKVLLLVPLLLFGCATKSDVENIQAQITPIKQNVRELFKENTKAKYAATRANRAADKAIKAAQRAQKANEEVNKKMDSIEIN